MAILVSHLLAFVFLQTKISQDVGCFKRLVKSRMYILFMMDTIFWGVFVLW